MRGENAIACRTGVIRKKIAPVLQTKNAKKNATEVSGQERASVTCKASNWPQARYLPVLLEHSIVRVLLHEFSSKRDCLQSMTTYTSKNVFAGG